MGLLADAALVAAKTLAAQVGPEAALRTIVDLIPRTTPSPTRAAAVLEGLALAAAQRDGHAAEVLALHWAAESAASPSKPAVRALAQLSGAGLHDAAVCLAQSECDRTGHAQARWLYAVIRERAGTPVEANAADYALAAREAKGEGDERLAAEAERERGRLLLRVVGGAAELPAFPTDFAGAARAPARSVLIAAKAQLRARGRYARVAALDALAELMQPSPSDAPNWLRRASWRVVAEHVDRMGQRLTDAEAARVEVLAGYARGLPEGDALLACLDEALHAARSDAAEREAARARSLLATDEGRVRLDRMQAALEGRAPGPLPGTHEVEWRALSALAALVRGDEARARSELMALTLAVPRAPHAAAPAMFTAAWRGLAGAHTRAAATTLADALLIRGADYAAPPHGYLQLATHLHAARAPELARRALELASDALEPDAREALVESWVREGFRAHEAGRRGDAIAALERARALELSGG